jgi:hypothetical protein
MKKETLRGKYFENIKKVERCKGISPDVILGKIWKGQEENLEKGKDSKIELKGKINSEGA